MAWLVRFGLDLVETVFQIHAIGSEGTVLIRRKLRRACAVGTVANFPACLIGIEACASAHHWPWELIEFGHEVPLMPPAYLKSFAKRGKAD